MDRETCSTVHHLYDERRIIMFQDAVTQGKRCHYGNQDVK